MTANHINLLESEPTGSSQLELDYLSMSIAAAIFIIGCLGFVGWQSYNLSIINKRLDQITAEVNGLRASVSSEQKRATVADAIVKTSRPISWSHLLKKIFRMVPSSIYISQLTGSLPEKRKLILMGNSSTLSAVFTFKENLSKLPECEKISVANLNRATFQIECQIK